MVEQRVSELLTMSMGDSIRFLSGSALSLATLLGLHLFIWFSSGYELSVSQGNISRSKA